MSGWLRRQSFSRVMLLSAAWVLGLPAVTVAAFRLAARYAAWRHGLFAYRIDANWMGIAAILLLPPSVFFVTWWATRRAR